MNKANILKVADAIEQHSIKWLGFNMSAWFDDEPRENMHEDKTGHNCGTVACIGGWTAAVLLNRKTENGASKAVSRVSEDRLWKFLGLEERVAQKLFLPNSKVSGPWRNITPRQAVRVLKYLAETGKVDWSQAGAA